MCSVAPEVLRASKLAFRFAHLVAPVPGVALSGDHAILKYREQGLRHRRAISAGEVRNLRGGWPRAQGLGQKSRFYGRPGRLHSRATLRAALGHQRLRYRTAVPPALRNRPDPGDGGTRHWRRRDSPFQLMYEPEGRL